MQRSCSGPGLADLRRLFSYDPETGQFERLCRSGNAFPGDEVGCVRSDGYLKVSIGAKAYLMHRLAVQYMTGKYPADEVDHINGNRADNRWDNLRECDRLTNQQNRRKIDSDKMHSKLLGVFRNGKRWGAYIGHMKRRLYIGTYDTEQEAHEAYMARKRQLHAGCTL